MPLIEVVAIKGALYLIISRPFAPAAQWLFLNHVIAAQGFQDILCTVNFTLAEIQGKLTEL